MADRLFVRQNVKVWLEFGVLALVIMIPLLFPGYIFTLDLVFAPHASWPDLTSPNFLLQALVWLLYHVLPGDIIEKIILFGILIASGAGMFLLIQTISRPQVSWDAWRLASYIAGVFYVVNPFIYARFMAGQWMVLLGYALLPFFITALLKFLRLPSRKTSVIMAIWAIVVGFASIHHIGMVLLSSVMLTGGAVFIYRKDKQRTKQYLKWGSIAIGMWLLANIYWLVSIGNSHSELSRSVAGFDQSHFTAFATLDWPLSVLQMQGFWAEARQLFILPQQLMPLWSILIIILWVVMVYGAIKAWQGGQRWPVTASLSGILLAIVLSAPLFLEWVATWFPFAAGYREPHKFVNFLVVGYAVLLACGAAYVLKNVVQRPGWQKDVALTILLLLPLLITPTMFGGFAGQLSPRSYPVEWYEVDQKLTNDTSVDRVLFLPWHQYANFGFSGRLVANPAEKFFQVPVISSDNPEFKNISPTMPNEEKRQLTQAIRDKKLTPMLLNDLNITHILLAKEQDWGKYKEIIAPGTAELINENNKLQLYKVKR